MRDVYEYSFVFTLSDYNTLMFTGKDFTTYPMHHIVNKSLMPALVFVIEAAKIHTSSLFICILHCILCTGT